MRFSLVFLVLFFACATLGQASEIPMPANVVGINRVATGPDSRYWIVAGYTLPSTGATGTILTAEDGSMQLANMVPIGALGNANGWAQKTIQGSVIGTFIAANGFYPQAGVSWFGEMRPTTSGMLDYTFIADPATKGKYSCIGYNFGGAATPGALWGPFPSGGKLRYVGIETSSGAVKSTIFTLDDPTTCNLTPVTTLPISIGQVWALTDGSLLAERYASQSSTGFGGIVSEIGTVKSGTFTPLVSSDTSSNAKLIVSRCCDMVMDWSNKTALIVYEDSNGKPGVIPLRDGTLESPIDLTGAGIPAGTIIRGLSLSGRFGAVGTNNSSTGTSNLDRIVAIDLSSKQAWTVVTTAGIPKTVPAGFEFGKVSVSPKGTLYTSTIGSDGKMHLYRFDPPTIDATASVTANTTFTLSGKNLTGSDIAGISLVPGSSFACTNTLSCTAPTTPGTYPLQLRIALKDGVTLTSNTLTITVTAVPLPLPKFTAEGVVDAASGQNPCTPGDLCSLYGADLSATIAAADSLPLPTSLAGTKVLVNGVEAPLVFVSPTQINFQMPVEAAPPSATVQVVSANGSSEAVKVRISMAAPGVFQWNGYMIAQDLNYQLVGIPGNPVLPGSIIVIYATGLGRTTCNVATGQITPAEFCPVTAPVTVTLGGTKTDVLFAGLTPGFVGLYQINVQIPGNSTPEPTLTPVNVSVESVTGMKDASSRAILAQAQ